MIGNLKIDVKVSGRINNSDLQGQVAIEADPNTGIMSGELVITKRPRDFAVIAASGLSWWCNSNTGTGTTNNPRQRNLLHLSDFNYDLERTNEFPDGTSIKMKFAVRRAGPSNVTVTGEWEGTYGLPTDIVAVGAPIIERLSSDGPGATRSVYSYDIFDASGTKYSVTTPSRYAFKPISLSYMTIEEPQDRIMFFGVRELEANTRYRVISQSSIHASNNVGLGSFSSSDQSVPVKFR